MGCRCRRLCCQQYHFVDLLFEEELVFFLIFFWGFYMLALEPNLG